MKMKRRLFSLLLALALSAGLAVPAAAAGSAFSDVPASHWAYDFVEEAAANGWVSGVDSRRYAPDGQVSYAQFLTMVMQMFYADEAADYRAAYGADPYWGRPYVEAAMELGLLSNTNLFVDVLIPGGYAVLDIPIPQTLADAPLNRLEMAGILEFVLGDVGAYDLSVDMGRYAAVVSGIPDWDQIPSWQQMAVGDCYYFGLLSGVDSRGTFGGQSNMTRAEAAVVLCRLADTLYFAFEEEAAPQRPAQPEPQPQEPEVRPQEPEPQPQEPEVRPQEPEPQPQEPDVQPQTPEPEEDLLANGQPITQDNVRAVLNSMRSSYPERMPWNNDNFYAWQGGIFSGGYGCAGFAFMLSDAAFGDLPARQVYGVSISDVRAGDILRINGDTHSVIVLEVTGSGVVIAEGNYNSSIHWDRTLSAAEVNAADYMLTRYPD